MVISFVNKKRMLFLMKMAVLTIFISVLIPFVFRESVPMYGPVLFINLFPMVMLFKKSMFLKKGPFKSIGLIFYYIIFAPLLDYIFKVNIVNENEIFLKFINILTAILLSISFISLIQYSFIDLLMKRRRIERKDLLVAFLTYIILAVVFGAIYTIINKNSVDPAFYGIDRQEQGLYFYFQHVYFSFVTMTTVGYGDIHPIKFIIQFLAIIEILIGIVLLNCILAIILSSGIFHFTDEENNRRNK